MAHTKKQQEKADNASPFKKVFDKAFSNKKKQSNQQGVSSYLKSKHKTTKELEKAFKK